MINLLRDRRLNEPGRVGTELLHDLVMIGLLNRHGLELFFSLPVAASVAGIALAFASPSWRSPERMRSTSDRISVVGSV